MTGEIPTSTVALAKLVRSEYPSDETLATIAETWGRDAGLNEAEIASLVELEASSPLLGASA